MTADLELDVEEAVRAYAGRQQVKVNLDEVKELSLANYMGRGGQGVRRWSLFLCAAQMASKFITTRGHGNEPAQVALVVVCEGRHGRAGTPPTN